MSIRNMMIGGAGASPPDAPTSVVATATGSTTMSVAFSAPANNGGSAITSFTVTSSPGGLTGTGSSSPITVSGLTASTSYTFTVTATNAIGTGVASSASSAVSTQAPSLYSFTTATFTPGGRRGKTGPTVAQMRSGVGSPSWAATYLNTGDVAGIQAWTVPATGNYDITVAGASGGVGGSPTLYRAGRGIIMKGTFSLNSSEVLYMCAGQRGGSISEASGGGGGGGASFVALSNRNTASLMIIAGAGGGGDGNTNKGDGGDAQSGTSGGVGTNASSLAGSSGAGGGYGQTSHPGGAGWLSNGGTHADPARTTSATYASALSNAGDARGGAGGACEASMNPSAANNWDLNGNHVATIETNGSGQGTDQGGFGGGGAGEWCSAGQCGGGGGYSGGGGSASSNGSGGGGGSLVSNATGRLVTNSGSQGYNPTTSAVNPGAGSVVGSAKTNYGVDGYIIITKV